MDFSPNLDEPLIPHGRIQLFASPDGQTLQGKWIRQPSNVLVYRKPGDPQIDSITDTIIEYLLSLDLHVFLEVPEFERFVSNNHVSPNIIAKTEMAEKHHSSPLPFSHPLASKTPLLLCNTPPSKLLSEIAQTPPRAFSTDPRIQPASSPPPSLKKGSLDWVIIHDPLNDLTINYTGNLARGGHAITAFDSSSVSALYNDHTHSSPTPPPKPEPHRFHVKPTVLNSSVSNFHLANIDCIIVIGGDGTLLRAAGLFSGVSPKDATQCPLILPFYAGSLGFMTSLPLSRAIRILQSIFEPPPTAGIRSCWRSPVFNLVQRDRLFVRIVETEPEHKLEAQHSTEIDLTLQIQRDQDDQSPLQDSADSKNVVLECHVMNDVMVSGIINSLCTMEIGINSGYNTTIQGSGLVVATATGSSGVSLSGGGPILHPGLPCILLTPLLGHTLSFRPLVLPSSSTISIGLSAHSRHQPVVTFDGRGICLLRQNARVEVRRSESAVLCVCEHDNTTEWLTALELCLGWNTTSGRGKEKEDEQDEKQSQDDPPKIPHH